MAAFSELYIEQYADFSTTVNVDDLQGDAINLSSYAVASQLKKSYYSSTSYNFTVEVTDAVRGEITVSMDSANTSNLSPGRYIYDLTMTDPNNITTRVVEGIVVVLPGVTKNG